MRPSAVSAILLCSVAGLTACGSSTSGQARTTLPKITNNTVFTTLPPATTLPAPTAAPPTDSAGAVVTTTTTLPGGASTYTVQANDLLVRIAKKFNCKYTDILTANSYTGDPNKFLPAVGQTIALPPTCKQTAATATSTATATTTKGTKTTTTVASKGGTTVPATTLAPGTGGTYTVKAGDYLNLIAKNFGTTAAAIVTANGWTDGVGHHINVGDVIKLPAKK